MANLDDFLGPELYSDGVLAGTGERRRKLNLIGGPTVTDDPANGRLDIDFSAMKIAVATKRIVVADLSGFGESPVTFDIGSALSATSHVVGVSFDLTTPFSGGGAASVTADIGTSGDIDAIVDGADLFAAAVDGQVSSMPFGIARHKRFAAATQLKLTFATDVAPNTLTAGDVTAYVLLSKV